MIGQMCSPLKRTSCYFWFFLLFLTLESLIDSAHDCSWCHQFTNKNFKLSYCETMVPNTDGGTLDQDCSGACSMIDQGQSWGTLISLPEITNMLFKSQRFSVIFFSFVQLICVCWYKIWSCNCNTPTQLYN